MLMKPSICFSSGTMRCSISSCCFNSASCCSICFSFGRYDSTSLFSRIFSSRACCAAAFLSTCPLKTVKYNAAVTIAPPRSTVPHCLIPDSSLKFAIGLPLRLPLLAGQGELEGLHVFDRLVLERFLDLNRPEVASLLQVRNQIGDGIGAQGRPLKVYRRSRVIHLVQPHSFGVVD